MKQSKLTVTILIDACRNDYISKSNAPFLYSIKQEGISGSLIPTFGFEPDAAYLAGLWPDESDGGMHFWNSPITSPFKNAKFILRHFDIFPKTIQKVLRRILSIYVRRTANYSRPKYVTSISRIPFKVLGYFDLSEKYLLYEDKFANRKSIFTALKNNNKSFYFHGAPTCPTLPEDIYKGLVGVGHPFDFIFLHTGILDGVGHKYGPFSDEVSFALSRLDRVIKNIWDFLKKTYGEFNLVIIGDHGMVEVKEIVNIETKINALDLKLGEDYLYFLDSTLARFWFFNEKAKFLITTVLSKVQQGKIFTQEDKNRYHLNYSHNKFGDLYFLVTPGVLIFPNYWNNNIPENGMHGYTPEYNGQQSIFIINSSFNNIQVKLKNPTDMRRIFPTLLKLTGLDTYIDLGITSIV